MKYFRGRGTIVEQCPEILTDESRFTLGVPDEVWFPENSTDLQEIMRRANQENIPVTFSGGRTGITGGAVPPEGGIVISFSSMKRILSCEMDSAGNRILHCHPGVTLDDISRFLKAPDLWPYSVEGINHLTPEKYFYPPDPTEMTAELGGTVATNASGARSFFFGPTRNHIEYLEIVLVTGELISLKRDKKNQHVWNIPSANRNIQVELPSYTWPQVKNASGYYSSPQLDPVDLFIGSEGTLGAICSIGIRLIEKPVFLSGLSFFPSRNKAFDFADFLREEKQVAAIEYFDQSVFALFRESDKSQSEKFPAIPSHLHCAVYWEFIEKNDNPLENRLEDWEEALKNCGSSLDDTWSGFDSSESQTLKNFRHAVPELINSIVAQNKRIYPLVRKISTDTAIPGSHFRTWFLSCIDLLQKEALPYAAFGHLGDFHLHINILPRTEQELKRSFDLYHEFMHEACKNGGTISAEHGIGKLKRGFLSYMYDEEALEEMRRIKGALDPGWQLNKGTLV